MRLILIGLIVAVGVATGCAAKRTSVPDPVSLPESFSQTGASELPEKWWQALSDPVLDALIEKALAGNFSLRTAWDRLSQAEWVARKSGAPLWPELDGTAGASRTITRNGARTEQSQFSVGLLAGYEVDLWGRIRSSRDAAILDATATREQVQAGAITLSAAVASVWYAIVEQRGQVALLERQIKTNEDVLELITLRFRRGQVGAADVLQQRQLVEVRRGEMSTAQMRVTLLENQLAILTGTKPGTLVLEQAAELIELPALPATGVPAEVLARRPDVRFAAARVLAADRRVAAAFADRLPRLSLVGQWETVAPEWRDLFDNWMATLAGNLVAPLFDAGARGAESGRTRAVLSERLNEYGQTVLEALTEVENALVQERQQRELIESLEKQLVISGQVIERTRDSYVNGAVDYLRVLTVLLTHQSLQRNIWTARRQLVEYRIGLYRALAGGWEMKAPKPSGWRTE
jgi:NodT family efflux transporter outer membrane factor (OMF) lipoprotein